MANNSSEVVFTREQSVAEAIEGLIQKATVSVDAALYRFNSQRLAHSLEEASERGLRVRLVIDYNKFKESQATRELLANGVLPFRLSYGRNGPGSKMHHKFVLVDGQAVVTGSYNWTLGSEEKNYENVLILREPRHLKAYQSEFDSLWTEGAEPNGRKS